jgi:starvation-inducible DNA-binding protein
MAKHAKDHADHATTHATRNDVPSNAKSVALALLNARLADGIDLALITKQAHWNLKGPQFIAVHEMLDGTPLGPVQTVTGATKLPPYPTDIYSIADHLAALIDRYAAYANAIRHDIDESADAGDAGTSDIFTEISRGIDKQLWFLEAHVQSPMGTMRDGNEAATRQAA